MTKPDVSTFEKYKNFINETYGGFQNAFQVVNRAFDLQFDPKEKFFIFSNKLTDELRTSLVAIKRHFKKLDGEKELSADECIDFIGALCMSQKLKENHWDIFRDMTNDFDHLKNANEVAQKAEFYRERLQGAMTTSSTFWGKTESKQKPEIQPKLNNLNLDDAKFRAYLERYNPNFSGNRNFRDRNFSDKKSENDKNTKQDTSDKSDDKNLKTSFLTTLDAESPFQ